MACERQGWNQGLPLDSSMTEETLGLGNKKARSLRPDRKKEEQALHRVRETRGRRSKTRHRFRPNAGRPGKWTKGSSHKGAGTKISAASHIEPWGDLRNQCQVTAPMKGNQEAMSCPEGQDKTPKLNKCKGTIQIDGKTERRLLVMITAGTVCQTTSYSPYRGGVAISELLVTGTQGRDTNKAWDLNNMPVERVVIAPEAFSPETLAPGNNPT